MVSSLLSPALATTIATVALLASSTTADAFYKICNKSDQTVYVAIGYEENDDWIAEGWWELGRGDCRNIINGNLSNRYYYIRAEGREGRVWSGDYYFCTTPEAFKLIDAEDCVSSRIDREGFFMVDTGESSDWTTNLTINE